MRRGTGRRERGRARRACLKESQTYRVGMRWLTLTYFTNGFSFVRFVTFALLMAFVTCCTRPVKGEDGKVY